MKQISTLLCAGSGTNESSYIPAVHRRRLDNSGVSDVVMIEGPCGEYQGKDDSVRLDIYGRG
jgi:mannose-6-phosphate isomerase-like protein (cupin superfamily)